MVPFSQAQSLWVPPIIHNAFRCYRRELWQWRLDSANCIEFENIFIDINNFCNIFTAHPVCISDQRAQLIIGNSLTLCAARITPDDICLYYVFIFDLKCMYILQICQQFRTWCIIDGCPMNICHKLKSSGVENTRRRIENGNIFVYNTFSQTNARFYKSFVFMLSL